MYTTTDIRNDDVALEHVNGELQRQVFSLLHDAHGMLHTAMQLIWLLPDGNNKTALQRKLDSLTEDLYEFLNSDEVSNLVRK